MCDDKKKGNTDRNIYILKRITDLINGGENTMMKTITFKEEEGFKLIYEKIAKDNKMELSEWIRKTLSDEVIRFRNAKEVRTNGRK